MSFLKLFKPQIHTALFNKRPPIGIYKNKQILLGGFSSLEIIAVKNKVIKFRTITDRGPNAPVIAHDKNLGHNLRPFLLKKYSPMIVEFELNSKNQIQNIKTVSLFADSQKISGVPPFAQTKKNFKNVEQAVFQNKMLLADKNGFDSEGLCTDRLGRTWVSEEYYPSFAVFDKNKKLVKRFIPGVDFPLEYAERKLNRGFEGLTCDQNYLYVMLQSPIPIAKAKNKLIIRILRFDLKTLKAKDQFGYALQHKSVDKIGDIAVNEAGHFFVFEQNGQLKKKSKQYIFKTKLTDKNAISLSENPELWTQKQLQKKSVPKELIVNLSGSVLADTEKIEGLAVYKNKIFLICDNDFGLIENKHAQIHIDNKIHPKLFWFEYTPKEKL